MAQHALNGKVHLVRRPVLPRELRSGRPLLIDKLGERLLLERIVALLYDKMLGKLQTRGGWVGGPSRKDFLALRDAELAHVVFAQAAMQRLDADPATPTLSAQLGKLEIAGLVRVAVDRRTTLAQSLHAIYLAELGGRAAWSALAQVADILDYRALGTHVRAIVVEEEAQIHRLHLWTLDALTREAHGGRNGRR